MVIHIVQVKAYDRSSPHSKTVVVHQKKNVKGRVPFGHRSTGMSWDALRTVGTRTTPFGTYILGSKQTNDPHKEIVRGRDKNSKVIINKLYHNKYWDADTQKWISSPSKMRQKDRRVRRN